MTLTQELRLGGLLLTLVDDPSMSCKRLTIDVVTDDTVSTRDLEVTCRSGRPEIGAQKVLAIRAFLVCRRNRARARCILEFDFRRLVKGGGLDVVLRYGVVDTGWRSRPGCQRWERRWGIVIKEGEVAREETRKLIATSPSLLWFRRGSCRNQIRGCRTL